MSRTKLILLSVLLLIIALAAALWARNNMYYETVESTASPSPEARRNQFLAVERLLESRDIKPIRKISRGFFNDLDSINNQALWLQDLNNLKTDEEIDKILSWVKAGGHLLAQVESLPYYDDEPLYTNLKENRIELVLSDDEKYPDHYQDELSIPLANASGESIQVSLSHRQVFKTDLDARLQVGDNDVGSRLLQVPLGSGYVTLLSDYYAFNNYQIEEHDHAYLFLWLLGANPDLSTLAIMDDLNDTPGLFQTLYQNYTLAFFALAVVLIGSLIRAGSRLGPILEEPAPGGKNLISHLKARGFFLARQKRLGPMLLPIRAAAAHALGLRSGVRRAAVASATETFNADTLNLAAKLTDSTVAHAEMALTGELNSSGDLVDSCIVLHRILHPQQNKLESEPKTNT